MYKLKPYCDEVEVELPKCMYSLKKVHGSTEGTELTELERRQEAILNRLAELQLEVDKLAKGQSVSSTENKGKSARVTTASNLTVPMNMVKEESVTGPTVKDIVICAHPSSPPYSVLSLVARLSQQYKVTTAVHTHSSISNVPAKLTSFFSTNGLSSADRWSCQVAVTLIWKDVKNGPVLMTSPNVQCAIHGEGNVARYLARLIKPSYENTDIVTVTQIDNIIDQSSAIVNGSTKEKGAALKGLNATLGKSTWLVGSQASLADVVCWSAIHQSGSADSVPNNVKKWLKLCNETPVFKSAASLL